MKEKREKKIQQTKATQCEPRASFFLRNFASVCRQKKSKEKASKCKRHKDCDTMKEIVNFFSGRRYSAVHTSEMQMMGAAGQKTKKSLQSKPALDRGISVLDALFHERQSGKRTRWPKSKLSCWAGEVDQCHKNAKFQSTK